jgi:2-keto-4-pentenoate hydratase
MSSTALNCQQLAAELAEAERTRRPVSPLTERYPDLSIADAYEVQQAGIAARLGAGSRIWGRKVGLTSLAMQRALGVDEPDFGVVLDDMVLDPNLPVDCGELIQPRIEAEIAFVLSEDLSGPGVTALDVLRVSGGVVPALELIDSRIEDWRIKLIDTVADNASSARVAIGSRLTRLDQVDLPRVGVCVTANGDVAETGAGAAVLGDPLNCVAWLANKLSDFGEGLHAGEVILAGAMHKAIDVAPGNVIRADFAYLGSIGLRFGGKLS